MDLDTSVGSLSKRSRREKGTDPSDDEEPTSSPVTSSPLPLRSSPPPEEVKEVTTGVKDIELDQKPEIVLSNPSEAAEPSVTVDSETFVETEETARTEEGVTPEQRPEEENTSDGEGSQDLVEGVSTDEDEVKPPTNDSKDTIKVFEECVKPSVADSVSPTKAPQPKPADPLTVVSEDEPHAKA